MNYQEYLLEHGINDESVKKFGLTGDNLRLNIPVKDASGNLKYVKQRNFTGDKFYTPKGTKTTLFNSVVLANNPKYVIITAGEIDCVRLNQEGLTAVSGGGGEMTWKGGWTDQIKHISKIFLCQDNDKTGVEATKKLFLEFPDQLIPLRQTKSVEFPKGVKDVCEFFKQYNLADFQGLLRNSINEEEFVAKHPEVSNPKKKNEYIKRDTSKIRTFHPALHIDRENQEVMVGIPRTEPVFNDEGEYKISESIVILNNKGETWPLIQEEMEERGLYPTPSSMFGASLNEGSLKKAFTMLIEAKSEAGEGGEGQKSPGGVNSYHDVFMPIKDIFETFVEFSNPYHSTLLSLWVMGTYIYPIFEAFPYISLGGPKGSGKSKVLDILSKLVFNPLKSSNSSPSIMFRTIEANKSTVLFDEGESLTGREPNPDLRLILNAGYKSNNYVTRSKADTFEPEKFDVYSPKAIASINLLDSTLATRCISLIMLRTASKVKGRSRINDRTLQNVPILVSLYRFLLQDSLKIATIFDDDQDLSDLNNRNNELYLPLFSIAAYLDEFSPTSEKILPLIQKFAAEAITEDDSLDDWTMWVLDALSNLVTDYCYYLVKDIRKTISTARIETGEFLDEKMSNQWISGCLRKFGFRKSKHTKQGNSYLIKKEDVEELINRYTPTPSAAFTTFTGVTSEAKNDGEGPTQVNHLFDNSEIKTDAKPQKPLWEDPPTDDDNIIGRVQEEGIRQKLERKKQEEEVTDEPFPY